MLSTPSAVINTFLNGQVHLWQPTDGYRAAIDPVILAAAVNAQAGETVLDAGMGVGTATFCLAHRIPGLSLTGIELQPELADLARQNSQLNNIAQMQVLTGCLSTFLQGATAPMFDHVITNPPFGEKGTEMTSPSLSRALSHQENALSLAEWLTLCGRRVKPQGTLTIIHKPDRVGDILNILGNTFGGLTLFPLWPRAGEPCNRIIIQGKKSSRAPSQILPGLILHKNKTGRTYTDEAEAILRHGRALSDRVQILRPKVVGQEVGQGVSDRSPFHP